MKVRGRGTSGAQARTPFLKPTSGLAKRRLSMTVWARHDVRTSTILGKEVSERERKDDALGKPTPPTLLPLATMPIASALLLANQWLWILIDGRKRNPTPKPPTMPWMTIICPYVFASGMRKMDRSHIDDPKAMTARK